MFRQPARLLMGFSLALGALASFAHAEDEVAAPGTPPEKTEADDRMRGIEPGLRVIADGFANLSGGTKQGVRGTEIVSGTLALDGKKLIGAQGLKAFVNVLHNGGGQPDGDLVGTYGIYDNIEASPKATRLEEAWAEQEFYDGRAGVKLGVVDINNEFYQTEASSRFVHSTFGIGSEFALSGNAGPPTYPLTALSARLLLQPVKEFYALATILDGTVRDADQPRGTHLHVGGHDGALLLGEAGYTPGSEGESVPDKFGFGAWVYTRDIDRIDGSADPVTGRPVGASSQGAYVLAQKRLWKADPGRGLHEVRVFARVGYADPDSDVFDWAGSAGVVMEQPFHDSEGSEFGLGMHAAHKTVGFRTASAAAGNPQGRWEGGVETYYRWQATEWLAVQPDAQYLTNPNALGAHADAVVAGLRLDASF